MEKQKNNGGIIKWLIGLLLLVVIASAAVLWFLPPATPLTTPLSAPDSSPVAEIAAFDLKLFNRLEFQTLNLQLVSNGSLPVEPPAAIGKANPFL